MKRICTLLTALALSFCMAVPVSAAYYGVYVYDPDSILEETDAKALSSQAAELVDAYDCGVYLCTVSDFTAYGYEDIYEFAQDYYEENLLGCGEERDGILLALSTETRDVSLAIYGPWAQTVFTDYAQELVWDAVLEDFGNSDWSTGCQNYLTICQVLLSDAAGTASAGTPAAPGGDLPEHIHYGNDVVHTQTQQISFAAALGKAVAMSFLPAVIIAFVACGVMKRKMKTARKASGASAYVTGSVDLKVRTDHYTHSTVVRTPINRDNGPKGGGGHRSGGTRVNSRGFSGGSRKF